MVMRQGALSLFVGGIAGISAYYVYPQTGVYSSIIVGLGVAWLLFGLTNPGTFLTMLGFCMNPPMAALISFFLAFIYFSVEGFQFWQSFAGSFVVGILGGLLGFIIFNYWNISS